MNVGSGSQQMLNLGHGYAEVKGTLAIIFIIYMLICCFVLPLCPRVQDDVLKFLVLSEQQCKIQR